PFSLAEFELSNALKKFLLRKTAGGDEFGADAAHFDQPVPTEEVGGAEAAQEGAGGQHEAATTSNLLYRCICNI
ncbi:unnamed protein product, partial [Closterium sp. NIES-54]